MIDIVNRLRFDAIRCEAQFSKGVAGNITEAADEIERLRAALDALPKEVRHFKTSAGKTLDLEMKPGHYPDYR